MTWLKSVVLDVAVTGVIVLAVTMDLSWARWIVLLYTPLMLLLKLIAFFGGALLGTFKRSDDDVPAWFHHGLYAMNVVVPLLGQWWLIAGGWAVIWGLSVAAEHRVARPVRTS